MCTLSQRAVSALSFLSYGLRLFNKLFLVYTGISFLSTPTQNTTLLRPPSPPPASLLLHSPVLSCLTTLPTRP